MNHFFFNALDSAEHQRLLRLEPFDEFEEWHLKCGHYILLTAAKGSCVSLLHQIWPQNDSDRSADDVGAIKGEILQKFEPACDISVPNGPGHAPKLSTLSPMNYLSGQPDLEWSQTFGHASNRIKLGNEDYVVSCGGFGMNGNHHSRIQSVVLLSVRDGKVSLLQSNPSNGCPTERMYHTATRVDDASLLVLWGRKSPLHPCSDYYVLRFSESYDPEQTEETVYRSDGNLICLAEKVSSYSSPNPRWRHSATFIHHAGLWKWVQIVRFLHGVSKW